MTDPFLHHMCVCPWLVKASSLPAHGVLAAGDASPGACLPWRVHLQGARLVFGSVGHTHSQLCPALAALWGGAEGTQARLPRGAQAGAGQDSSLCTGPSVDWISSRRFRGSELSEVQGRRPGHTAGQSGSSASASQHLPLSRWSQHLLQGCFHWLVVQSEK